MAASIAGPSRSRSKASHASRVSQTSKMRKAPSPVPPAVCTMSPSGGFSVVPSRAVTAS